MKIYGNLVLTKRNTRTKAKETLDLGSNIIVQNCATCICHVLAGDGANYQCNIMAFGVGTAPEQVTDTSLTSAVTPAKTPVFTYDAGPPPSAEFVATLDAGDANGFPISEAGLFAQDGTMMAHKTFTPQTKTADYTFTFTWTITRVP